MRTFTIKNIIGNMPHDYMPVHNDRYKLVKKFFIFLVHCDIWYIRCDLAKLNYRLDILVNDPHQEVRMQVARLGYGLDKLIDDEDELVREIAKNTYKYNENRK